MKLFITRKTDFHFEYIKFEAKMYYYIAIYILFYYSYEAYYNEYVVVLASYLTNIYTR
jgi:hypothetical protein